MHSNFLLKKPWFLYGFNKKGIEIDAFSSFY